MFYPGLKCLATCYSNRMSTLAGQHLSTLCEDVQFNCAISDARYARNYSLCIYLMRMRDFYRWRFDIPLMQQLETDTVGDWISDTESHWDDIEELDFKPLVIDGTAFDPFDSKAINQQLKPSGLIYSAGVGRMGQPHFVLAELMHQDNKPTTITYECGKELARDSITLPAMTQDQTIYIRHDSIKRHIWQMIDEWRLQKNAGPLARIVEYYQLIDPDTFEKNLQQAAVDLSPLYHEHECGEVAAGHLLGERYHQLLQKIAGTRNEFYLRAVRDVLADCLATWPYLLTRRSDSELDFWLASVAGARLELLKQSSIMTQLRGDINGRSRFDYLSDKLEFEQQRWHTLAEQILCACEDNPDDIDIKAQAMALIHSSEQSTH